MFPARRLASHYSSGRLSQGWSGKHQLKPPAGLWGKPPFPYLNGQCVTSPKENQMDGLDQTGVYWARELKSRKSSQPAAPAEHELSSKCSLLGQVAISAHWAEMSLQTAPLWLQPFCNNSAVCRESSESPAWEEGLLNSYSLSLLIHNFFTSRREATTSGSVTTHLTHVRLVCPLLS